MTFFRLEPGGDPELPPEFRGEDVRFPRALARRFLAELSEPGEVVLDPFAGFGTTLVACEETDRGGWGVERDERRRAYARSLLHHPERLLAGDALRLADLGLPRIDLVLTSPPYMARNETRDPLTDREGTYESYHANLRRVFTQAAALMRPDARAVVEAANLRLEGEVTTLAWDLARTLGEVLRFEGETVVARDGYGYGYDHSYALVFSR